MTVTPALSKPDIVEYKKAYYQKNKAHLRTGMQNYYNNNKPVVSNRRHLLRYGITLAQREELFLQQDKCCALCRTDSPGSKLGWHLDHCHSTNVVRGLLCHHCNVMLGGAKDNPDILSSAISYLKDFEARQHVH